MKGYQMVVGKTEHKLIELFLNKAINALRQKIDSTRIINSSTIKFEADVDRVRSRLRSNRVHAEIKSYPVKLTPYSSVCGFYSNSTSSNSELVTCFNCCKLLESDIEYA